MHLFLSILILVLWELKLYRTLCFDARTDLFIRLDVLVPLLNGSNGAIVATRVNRGGYVMNQATGVFYSIFPINNTYIVSSDIGNWNDYVILLYLWSRVAWFLINSFLFYVVCLDIGNRPVHRLPVVIILYYCRIVDFVSLFLMSFLFSQGEKLSSRRAYFRHSSSSTPGTTWGSSCG